MRLGGLGILFLEGETTMMQPTDIKSHNFGKGLFGYKKTDVDQYVDTVYRAYDELFTENKNLREEKERLNKVIEESNLKIFELENKLNGKDSVEAADKKKRKLKQRKTMTSR